MDIRKNDKGYIVAVDKNTKSIEGNTLNYCGCNSVKNFAGCSACQNIQSFAGCSTQSFAGCSACSGLVGFSGVAGGIDGSQDLNCGEPQLVETKEVTEKECSCNQTSQNQDNQDNQDNCNKWCKKNIIIFVLLVVILLVVLVKNSKKQ